MIKNQEHFTFENLLIFYTDRILLYVFYYYKNRYYREQLGSSSEGTLYGSMVGYSSPATTTPSAFAEKLPAAPALPKISVNAAKTIKPYFLIFFIVCIPPLK